MDKLVSISEVCKILGVSRTTLYRMINDGRFPVPGSTGEVSDPKRRKVWRESVVKKALDDIMPSAIND